MHANIKIRGKVQGVFFRDSARKQAEYLEVKGFIQNEPDGTVYMEVEGKPMAVRRFIRWAKNGPKSAEVEEINVEETEEIKNFPDFKIKQYHGADPHNS